MISWLIKIIWFTQNELSFLFKKINKSKPDGPNILITGPQKKNCAKSNKSFFNCFYFIWINHQAPKSLQLQIMMSWIWSKFPINNYNTNMRESEHRGTSTCGHTCLLVKRIVKATITPLNNYIICHQIIYIFQSVIIHHFVRLVPPNVRRGFRLAVPGSVCCDPDLTRCSPINLSLSGSKLCLLIRLYLPIYLIIWSQLQIHLFCCA